MYEQSGFSSYSAIQNFKVRCQWAENPPYICNWISELDFTVWANDHILGNNMYIQATVIAGFVEHIYFNLC